MEHSSNEKSLPHYLGFDQLQIDGKWQHGKGAKVLRDFNPYSGEVIVEIPHASRDGN